MSDNFNKNRILKNSLLLYVRMLFTMWLNLYATRLTLANLGVEEMGVYGVVGSIVSIFTVFTGGIRLAVQRFITYELGKKDGELNKVFCTSLNVLILFSVLLFILLEIGGVWMLDNKIDIPVESREAAFWVFQLSVLTCIVNMVSIPYDALIVAHEKINAFAAISIIQVILTCASAYCLSFFTEGRLIIYALLMAVIAIGIRLMYQIYCRLKFKDIHYHWLIDKKQIYQIGKFAGISSLSGIFHMIASQGLVLVINWTYGVALNAVYNIALQLKNAILSFSLNLLKAISPQITKTYASGEIEAHKKLVYSGSKMEVFLIYFILIPFLFKTEYILGLWLEDVPEYTVAFARCVSFLSLTYAAFEPIRTALLATNNIVKFSLIPDFFLMFQLPIAYIVSKLTNSPDMMIVSIVITDIACCGLRFYYGSKVSVVCIREFLSQVFLPCLKVAVVTSILCGVMDKLFSDTIVGLIILLLLNSLFLIATIYMMGLSKAEKRSIANIVRKKKIARRK